VGRLTTHVLDTAHGKPGDGMAVTLYRRAADHDEKICSATTNADGRVDTPLLQDAAFTPGRYRLVFAAGAYFRRLGVALAEPPFVDEIVIDFGVSDANAHYHVPLLVSPWSYVTYRGS
jgi:5-hydroxyisourate hydrolase